MTKRWIGIAAVVALAAGAAWAKGGKAPPPGPPTMPPSTHELVVEDSQGKPVAKATVRLLNLAGADEHNDWLAASAEGVSDAEGRVKLVCSNDFKSGPTMWPTTCYFAWRGDESAFACQATMREGFHVRLSPGRRVACRVVGPDGKPPVGAKARIAIAGAQEWHFVDVEVGKDGSLVCPPFPEEALRHALTHVEVRAPGCVEAQAGVGLSSISFTTVVQLVASRRVRGAVKATEPIADAVVRTSDFWHGPQAKVGDDGTFALDRLAPEVRRVYVTSTSHATRVVDLPTGSGPADLGVIQLEFGAKREGELAGVPADARVELGVVDDQGVAVASLDGVRGSFAFPHVGAGAARLAARVGGPGGALWIFDRGKFDGALQAPPFELRFDVGQDSYVEEARITWRDGGRTESFPVRMFSYTLGVTSVRLRLPGAGSLTVEAAGAKTVELDHVDVDADGRGSATVVVQHE